MVEEAERLRRFVERVKQAALARQITPRGGGDTRVLLVVGEWQRASRLHALAVAKLCEQGDSLAEAAEPHLRALLEISANVGFVLRASDPPLVAQQAMASQLMELGEMLEVMADAAGNLDIQERMENRRAVEQSLATLDPTAVEAARRARKRAGHWSGLSRAEVASRAGIPRAAHQALWKLLSSYSHQMLFASQTVSVQGEGPATVWFQRFDAERAEAYARNACKSAGKMLLFVHRRIAEYFDLPFVSENV